MWGGAGDEDPPDGQRRLVRTTPQRTEQLSLPAELGEDDGFRVEGTSRDGTVYLSTGNDAEQALWSLRDRRWAPVITPGSLSAGHAGDGGPALDATTELLVGFDVGPDGTVYLLEPHAVRAITSDGLIRTVAGSDRSDQPPDADPFARWGAAGLPDVTPDPRPLPTDPVDAASTPLPRLTAMDVDQDGTIWLASHDAVLRLDRDGSVRVHADATTTSPTTPAAALVGRRGSSSSISSLRAHDGVLDLIDSWSGRILRLQNQQLTLLTGPTTDQRDFPAPQLGQLVPLTNLRAREFVPGDAPQPLIAAGGGAIIALPATNTTS